MLEVLFVDDEKPIVNSMKRLVRIAETDIDFSFSIGSDEASTILDEKHFDVLVSDMNMPGKTGAELAEQAKKRNPEIITIILSGNPEPGLTNNPDIDAVLSKPFTMQELIGEIKAGCNDD